VPFMPLAIRDKIVANSQPFLDPGEVVQHAFPAQTFNGNWAFLSALIVLFKNSYRCVVVTDRRIAVLDSGKWAQGTPKTLLRSLPRQTQIGPAKGLWYKTENLGERLYIHKRFHKDIAAADTAAGFPG